MEPHDQIMEYAMLSERSVTEQLCGITVPVHPSASAAHHLTASSVEHCPPAAETLLDALAFHQRELGEEPYLVAHNAKFDRQYLDPLLPTTLEWICTYRCALHIWPDAPTHSNQGLRYWLDLEFPEHHQRIMETRHAHRALYDCVVTYAIFEKMLQTHTLQELHKLTSSPVLLTKVRFGKHEGKQWSEVDSGYMEWVLRQQDFDEDTIHTCRHYLAQRRARRSN